MPGKMEMPGPLRLARLAPHKLSPQRRGFVFLAGLLIGPIRVERAHPLTKHKGTTAFVTPSPSSERGFHPAFTVFGHGVEPTSGGFRVSARSPHSLRESFT